MDRNMQSLMNPIYPGNAGALNIQAPWITHPLHSRADDYSFMARRKISYTAVPERALLHICAHSRYVLFINGAMIATGPARASDSRAFYDSYDVRDFLRQGENHLAAMIYHSGMPCRTSVPGTPALWVQWDINPDRVEEWQTLEDASLSGNAREFTFQIGFCEHRDLRLIPDGWQTFNDIQSAWATAKEISFPGRLLPRDIPGLTRDMLSAPKPFECGYVPIAASDDDYAILLDSEPHTPCPSAMDTASGCLKAAAGAGGVYMIFDFGREVLGSVIIEIDAADGTTVDVTFNEALDGDRPQSFFRFTWKPRAMTRSDGYRFADRYILREGNNRIEQRLRERGGRFIQLVIRGGLDKIRFKNLSFENRIYPICESAAFESDNGFLTRLWDMCRHTVRHCVSDSFIDCPWREQAFWINDMLVSNLYYFMLSSDPAIVRRCLKLAVDGFRKYGFMPAVYPAGDTMFFLSMPALWTLTFYEYHLYSGDAETKDELLPAMDEILSVYEPLFTEKGLVKNHESWWNFIDIGYPDAGIELKGHSSILNVLIAAACKCAASLHSGKLSGQYRKRQDDICTALERHLWNSADGYFRDSDISGHGLESLSVHPHALALVYDLFPRKKELMSAAIKNPDAIQAEPYFQRFVLEALTDNGNIDAANKIISELWGKMVNADSHAIWEIAKKGPRVKGCESLCHAFSCAPIGHIHRNILGIRPLKPGFEKFTFNPMPGEMDKIKLSQPTPHGNITVSLRDKELVLSVPPGLKAVLPDGKELASGIHRLTLP